jgi:Skp family chaperone for outer membrane proteins
MKTLFRAALAAMMLAGATLAPQTAFAQAAAGVVVIDLNRVYSDSAAARSARAQIKAKYEANLHSAESNFNSLAAAYNAQVEAAKKVQKPDGSIPPANQKSLGDAQQRLGNADDSLQRMQNEVNTVGRYVQSQILEQIVPIAEAIRAERHATAVLAKGSLLASDPTADVTPTLIQRLDARLKAVSITLPQPTANPAAASGTPPQGR